MADKLIQDLAAGPFALTDLLEHQPIAGPPSLQGDINALVTLLNTVYAKLSGVQFTGAITFSPDNTLDIGAAGATRPRTGYFGTSVVSPLFTGALTGAASLNVLKAGDTMTGKLTITQGTANDNVLASTGYSLTGANAQSLIDLAGTWNTSGNPTALKIAITNTASGATSNFLQLLAGAAGATNILSISAAGTVTWLANGYLRARSPGYLAFGRNGPGDIIEFRDDIGIKSTVFLGWSPSTIDQLSDVCFSRSAAGVIEVNNGTAGTFRDLKLRHITQAAAALLSITSGSNQRAGNATLVGGTVTVANTTVTANTVILLTRKTSGGTIGTAITYTVNAGVSFVITSDNVLDTSTFSFFLLENP